MSTTTMQLDSQIQKLISLQWLYYSYRYLGGRKKSKKENKK